jgi:molybdenum cofactor synthesis domain-containing protein
MEAITAVTATLLNAYDMLKQLDGELSFGGIRVVRKKGGKGDFSDDLKKRINTAILVISDGGTGLGPRDVTPEATLAMVDRSVPGIAEAVMSFGRDRTPYAMLSRGESGVRGNSRIINLPGSSRGTLESLQALFPGLLHIFSMMQGKGHAKRENN